MHKSPILRKHVVIELGVDIKHGIVAKIIGVISLFQIETYLKKKLFVL
jgi:hypothetical protein